MGCIVGERVAEKQRGEYLYYNLKKQRKYLMRTHVKYDAILCHVKLARPILLLLAGIYRVTANSIVVT